MTKLQCMTECDNYTSDDNPNKTCRGSSRCVLWSDDCICHSYKDRGIILNIKEDDNANKR